MTEFEEQLTKAIEHGCPFCNGEWFDLWCIEERGYSVGAYKDITYDEHDGFQSSVNSKLICRCGEELWTSNHGWIPELQEAVK